MNNRSPITFADLRRLLESLGYRHERVERGEIFHQSKDRELYFRRYGPREVVTLPDLLKARRFLDAWGQLAAADFDAFLESSSKPA